MLNELTRKTRLDWRECRVSDQLNAEGSKGVSYWISEHKNYINLTEVKLWSEIERKFQSLNDVIKYINNKEAHYAN